MEQTPGNRNNDDDFFAALESEFAESPEITLGDNDAVEGADLLAQLESELVVDRQLLADALQLRIFDLEAAGAIPDMFAIDVSDIPFGSYDDCRLSADFRVGSSGFAHGWIEIKSNNTTEASPLPRATCDLRIGRWRTSEPVNDALRAFSDTMIMKTLAAQWPEHRYERGDVQKYSYSDTKDEYTAQDIARVFRDQLAQHADHYVTSSEFSQETYDQTLPDWQKHPKGKISLIYGRERSIDGEGSVAISLQRTVYHQIDGEMYSVIVCAQLDEHGDLALDSYSINNKTHLRVPLVVSNEPGVILELLTSLNSLTSSRI